MKHIHPTLARLAALIALCAACLFSASTVLANTSTPAPSPAAPTTHFVPPHSAYPVQSSIEAIATAYGSGTACNGNWPGVNAIGGKLRSGNVTSAAADWSKFPLGTKFRVAETGRIYIVDDYGSAMVGKVKVDLYTPSPVAMDKWGVRSVTLEILEWGDREKSLALLQTRTGGNYWHIRQMIEHLKLQVGTSGAPKVASAKIGKSAGL